MVNDILANDTLANDILASDIVRAVLDRLPMGVIMVTGEGRVLQYNVRAGRLLAAGDAFLIDPQGRFRLTHQASNQEMYNTIHALVSGGDAACALSAPRSSDRAPLSVLVVPVGGRQGQQGVVIFLAAPEEPVDIDPAVLSRLYGLTAAESRLVLGLLRGQRLEALAAEGGVSVHTVRSQLKAVFRKTGVSRQAELVKLILTGPAALRTGRQGADPHKGPSSL